MAGKREFLRDHKFTALDYLVCNIVTAVIAIPIFCGLIWGMGLVIRGTVSLDTALVLVILACLFSACAGLGAGIDVVRRMARRRTRPR